MRFSSELSNFANRNAKTEKSQIMRKIMRAYLGNGYSLAIWIMERSLDAGHGNFDKYDHIRESYNTIIWYCTTP